MAHLVINSLPPIVLWNRELEFTPSRKDGMTVEEESQKRTETAVFLQDAGIKLRLSVACTPFTICSRKQPASKHCDCYLLLSSIFRTQVVQEIFRDGLAYSFCHTDQDYFRLLGCRHCLSFSGVEVRGDLSSSQGHCQHNASHPTTQRTTPRF